MQTPTPTPNIILWFSTSKAWEVTKPQAKSVKIVKITFKRSHVFKFAFLLALVFIDFSRDWMRGLHGVSLLYWTCQHYPINQPINVILNVIVYNYIWQARYPISSCFIFRGARCSCVILVFRVSFFLWNGRSFLYNLHTQQNLVIVMPIGVFH